MRAGPTLPRPGPLREAPAANGGGLAPPPELIDSVAHLTTHRDRDQLDATIASILLQWLQPLSVSMHALVGQASDPRLLLRARLRQGETVPGSDPVWTPLDQLPRLAERQAFAQAMATRREVVAQGCNEPDGAAAVSTLFPVLTDRASVGVLEVVTRASLGLRECHLVTGMLRIYRNYLNLLDDSERDTLTGLLNRKTFEQTFGKLHSTPPELSAGGEARERRGKLAASYPWLGVIDIDHFKAVNDRHGHLIGDEVLLLVTRILHSTFRIQDRLFRFGGEEFVALVQCDGDDQAHTAFERLRVNVESYAFPQVGRLTVSIGYAQLRALDSPSAAFERADRAVYHAKQHGRNQVCSYDDLVARAVILEPGQGLGDVELF